MHGRRRSASKTLAKIGKGSNPEVLADHLPALVAELEMVDPNALPNLVALLVGIVQLATHKGASREPDSKRIKLSSLDEQPLSNELHWPQHQQASVDRIRATWLKLTPREKQETLKLVQLPHLAILTETSAPEWDEWLLQALCAKHRPACTLLELVVAQHPSLSMPNQEWLTSVRGSVAFTAVRPADRLALYLDPERACASLGALHRRWGLCQRGHAIPYLDTQLSEWLFDFLNQAEEPEVFLQSVQPTVQPAATLQEALVNWVGKVVPIQRLALFLLQAARAKEPAETLPILLLQKFLPINGLPVLPVPLLACTCFDNPCMVCFQKNSTRTADLPWSPEAGKMPLCSTCLSHIQRHAVTTRAEMSSYLWQRAAKGL